MINNKIQFLLILFVISMGYSQQKTKILLVGDSTTIGNMPRQVKPEGPHLEQMIAQLAVVEGLPELEVVNAGKGGETAKRLLGSKHYEQKIATVKDVDIIFLRMGINDWFKCKDFKKEFPVQMKALIHQLHKDHPKAVLYLATITSFMPPEECIQVNNQIYNIAKDQKLEVLDIFTPYNNYLIVNGTNSLNVRQCYLDKIPEKYHAWLKPYTYYRKGWGSKPDGYVVKVNDMSLDPIFGNIKGWYYDRHPNSTGYNLIAYETVQFLKKKQ
ncbi:SGNH/GDSL hydrolase family protein [Wenyingzhuangia sp. 2_MG-2023]|uniref:SGNH/GDSL hydrolase family protein n=1 Tax=Wenyingzhuangia sp. 2_MG-2023 TaxID=3062639 RepID=UPI0026E2DA14|nr:SGNH/GDSL hydrolase family protein [Wenyingzhuangia sp. 2_MG-2023]MDO6737027.1 SGNH/GDSL hydrolase family protein [Wenyingzhuangia sp. 2_MG-2023]